MCRQRECGGKVSVKAKQCGGKVSVEVKQVQKESKHVNKVSIKFLSKSSSYLFSEQKGRSNPYKSE